MNNYIPPVVKNLLIINVLFFLATMFLPALKLDDYLAVYFFNSPSFKAWQPISYMFMHGNFMHILFNMFALYSFGSVLESQWGAKRFINFFLITGLGALALQWGVQAFQVYQITGSPFTTLDAANQLLNAGAINAAQEKILSQIYFGGMVGASGAIFGLLVAFGMLYPNAELFIMFIPVPVKAKYIMPVYILLELSLGAANMEGDSVAHFAHLGGALLGFILVKVWKKKDRFYDYYE